MKLDIQTQIQHASKVVESWPAWKRNILNHSLCPTNSIARAPVDNHGMRSYSNTVRKITMQKDVIQIRPLWKRVLMCPYIFMRHYLISRPHCSRKTSLKIAYRFTRIVLSIRSKSHSEDLRDEQR